MKKNHNISLDVDISALVKAKQESGGLVLSRFINSILRERFQKELKER